jgi:hypothetical protein
MKHYEELCLASYCQTKSVRDMGTYGSPPTRVLEVPVKWIQLLRSPTDLREGPKRQTREGGGGVYGSR